MPERICRFVVLTAACATLLFGQRLLAATYVVGPSTCNSTRVHYSTIKRRSVVFRQEAPFLFVRELIPNKSSLRNL